MQSHEPKIQFFPAPNVSGAGGALLILMFFLPWFSACSVTLSGGELAFGKSVLGTTSSAGTYPWLALLLLAGAAALGMAIMSYFAHSFDMRRLRAVVLLVSGSLAVLLMALVLAGFIRQTSAAGSAGSGVVQVEYGFLGAWLGAVLMLGGALWDIFQIRASAAVRPAPVYGEGYAPPVAGHTGRAVLYSTAGPLAGKTIEITSDRLMIGRSVHNQAAVICYAQGNYYVQDQQNMQGILFNGRRVSASVLSHGDTITIGETTFEFRIVD